MKPQERRWSWTVGHVAGIELRIHATFLVLLAWLFLARLVTERSVVAAAAGLLVISVVFGVVVLHELGHALVARRFGIRTRDITLLPIGGVSRLERMPTDPRQELLVALAGPAVNVVLALATAVLLAGLRTSPLLLTQFLWLNVGLAVFNLLPAFPTDGGRVLRALLAMRLNRVRATDIAARVGRWAAIAFGITGLFANPLLVFVALFIWIGAAEEAAMVRMSAALEHLHVEDTMVTIFETISAYASVRQTLAQVIHSGQEYFPVVDGERLIGIVSLDELALAPPSAAVGAIVTPVAATTTPQESVETALERVRDSKADVLPVIDHDHLIGLLVPQNVISFAMPRLATAR